MHKILVDPRAAKQLAAISSIYRKRIVGRIDALQVDPRPSGCKKLRGAYDLYRIRIGDYRVVYQIRDKELLVLIVRIGHRNEVYR